MGEAASVGGIASVGGTSVPMLLFQIAASGKESIGTEVPPTKASAPSEARASAASARRLIGPAITPPPPARRRRPHLRRAPARAARASAAVSRRA
ncbi:DUF6053 domain-containing protein [Lysobacter enzymogenes]|uniref:DUF6053 domain-containing protein n=1 Tax=Lysobacter enzymogenes TaxID=69 RepID=UPI003D188504